MRTEPIENKFGKPVPYPISFGIKFFETKDYHELQKAIQVKPEPETTESEVE